MPMIKAASVQFNHLPGNKQANLKTIARFCEEAAIQEVEIIVFPEMCITGYWHVRNLKKGEIVALAENVETGPSVQILKALSNQHKLILGAGLIEQCADGRLYNAYVVVQPDGSIHCHRKLHTFISEHMTSGDSYTVFDTHLGYKVGVLICYDNNLIENVRVTALKGADILLAPHQTGGCESGSPHGMKRIDTKLWENRHKDPIAIEEALKGPNGRGWLMRWLPSRAHDNGLFIIFSNGVGIDDNEVRTGNAMIIDPYGRILAETWKAADAMVIAELDTDLLEKSSGRRWMRGRRPDLYREIANPSGEEISARDARFT
ncbi:MAG: nitrilase family protein [Verrucomicrobia bacterium]|nr:nitrilase family protein [Verrucomicrobiota bacterium]MDA1069662.1 nitrilase family protein [Verrucomicrobiota bacterium]